MRAIASAWLAAVGLLTCACVAPPTAGDRDHRFGPESPASAAVGGVLAGGGRTLAKWTQVTAAAREAVVRVRTRLCDGLATGSGFAITPRSVLTNAHVVRGGNIVTIDTTDGVEIPVASVDILRGEDLAVVHTAQDVPATVRLSSEDAVPGDRVEAMGFPLGRKLAVAAGRVVDYAAGGQYGEPGRVLRSSVEIRPGNSGGPLLDARGQVLGVTTAIDLESGSAIVIPAGEAQQKLSTAPRRAALVPCR